MLNLQLYQKVKVLYGPGSVSQIGELVTDMGKKKAFVVCDKGVKDAGIVDKIVRSLEDAKIRYTVFDGVLPDPPAKMVEAGYELCKKENCDVVIAVGGGSSIDTGKGINLLRFNERPVLRFTNFSTPMNPSPGLISIPTTAGTGSEVSDGIVLTNEEHVKCPILAPNAMSEYSVIDPELMIGMSPHLTAATGMDTLAHMAESYTSNATNTFVEFFTEKGMETVKEWLPIAVEDGKNMEARSRMAIASTVGGWMLGYGHTHAGHSVGHVLGAYFNIPHGFACAYALPYVLEFNAITLPEKTRKIGEVFDAKFTGTESPEKIGALTSEAVIKFTNEKVKVRSVKTFTYDETKFPEMAKAIANEMFQIFNPRKMTAADALEILKKIYR